MLRLAQVNKFKEFHLQVYLFYSLYQPSFRENFWIKILRGFHCKEVYSEHRHKAGKELPGFIHYSFNRSLSLIFDLPGTFYGHLHEFVRKTRYSSSISDKKHYQS